MIKKLTLASLFTSGILYADMAGGEFFIGMYSHSPSGYASYTEPYTGLGLGTSADLEDTLHWESNENIFLKAYIEHPVPLIPNVKVAFTQLSHEGTGEVGNDFVWGGIHIPTLGTVENSLDVGKYDLTLYYDFVSHRRGRLLSFHAYTLRESQIQHSKYRYLTSVRRRYLQL